MLQRIVGERSIHARTDGTTDPQGRKAFVHRLQGARKYVRLTKIFPESSLLAVPQVWVTRVDKLSHVILEVLEAAQDPTSLDMKRSIILTLVALRRSVRAGLDSMVIVNMSQ